MRDKICCYSLEIAFTRFELVACVCIKAIIIHILYSPIPTCILTLTKMASRRRIVVIITLGVLCCVSWALLSGYFGSSAVYLQSTKFDVSRYEKGFTIGNKTPRKYTSFDEPRNSSFVAPQLHPYYDVNCSALVHRDKRVVDQTKKTLESLRKKGNLVPSDKDVKAFTTNCEDFKKRRAYPTFARSAEELDYPIAYTIVAHTTAAQLERLLRAIYQPQNVYCIHPDANSPLDFQLAVYGLVKCFPNVFIPSKVEHVQYRGVTRLLADINCMKDLLSLPVQWKYVINLCGQDFPLKTNLEIVQQLKAFKGMNEIQSVTPPPWKVGRTTSKFKFLPGYELPINTGIRNSPPPHNITIYTGNAYGGFARSFVNFVIKDQEAVDLLKWMTYTWSPDENYWSTLLHHPRATPVWGKGPTDRLLVKMMRWGDGDDHPPCEGKYVRGLCIFGVGYLYHLTAVPHLFANKFYYKYDPICLQCLEQLLDYRANFPETVSDFVADFPVRD